MWPRDGLQGSHPTVGCGEESMSEPDQERDPKGANRGQMTLKSRALDPETMNAIRIAAGRQNKSVGDWCAGILREAALAVIQGGRPQDEPEPLAAGVSPATLDDIADRLAQRLDERVDQLRQETAAQLARLGRQTRVRGRVARR